MQPNLKVPQAPYVISPTSRIPRNTVMDASLDALIQQKMREAQYARQQQAVASRTPTVLFDPLLNLRVRDYYRQKYERTIASELAGRLVGGVEGGALGAGIGASIGGVVNTILTVVGAIEPTPIGEVAAAIGWGALAGATIGTTAGTAASDYSTWYATKDMFKNMWFDQSVGRGILNTMYFAGQSMDLASTATVVKSTLYSLVTGEDVVDIVRKAYGLTKEGRTDMDFSLIREALDLDFGGIGNFIFDMSGEMSSDLGAIAGIAGSVMDASKGLTKVYTKIMTEAGQKIMTEDALGKSVSKAFVRFIREGNVDDAMLYIKKLKLSNPEWIDDSLDMDNLRPVMEKYFKEINESAKKSVAVRLANSFKNIDLVDDFMTHTLWKAGSPVILGSSLLKEAKAHSILPKAMRTIFGEDRVMEIYEFFSGNLAKANNIKNPIGRTVMERIFKRQQYSFINNLVDYNGFKKFTQAIGDSITDPLQKEEFYKVLKEEGIDDIVKMKESNNPIVKAYYDKLSTEYSARLDELEKQIADKQKAQDLLRKRWEKTGKVSPEEVEKWDTLTKEIEDLMNSEEYKNLSFIKQMIENPVENVKLSQLVTKLKQLQTKQKVFGKLDATDEKELNKMFKTLVDEVVKGNELVENFFSEFRFDKAGSGRIGKTLKDFIAEHMDADITKQFKDFYDTKYEEFDKFARENVEAYKKSWTDQMVKRLQKAGVDLEDVFKDIPKKDIEARYRAIKSFLDTYENVDEVNLKLDKRSNAYKIQQELQKKVSEMNIFKNKFEQFISTKDLVYDEAYKVNGYTSQAAMRKRLALIKEGIKTMLSMDTSKVARQEIVVNLEELMDIIDKETFSDLESLNIFVNDILDAAFTVREATGKPSRILNNMIPKLLFNISEVQKVITPETFEIFNKIEDISESINTEIKNTVGLISKLSNHPLFKKGMNFDNLVKDSTLNVPKFTPKETEFFKSNITKMTIMSLMIEEFTLGKMSFSNFQQLGTEGIKNYLTELGKNIFNFYGLDSKPIVDDMYTLFVKYPIDDNNVIPMFNWFQTLIRPHKADNGLWDSIKKFQKEFESYNKNTLSPEFELYKYYNDTISSIGKIKSYVDLVDPETGSFSKNIKSDLSKISRVYKLDEMKQRILKELNIIEQSLSGKNVDGIRKVIKETRDMLNKEDPLSWNTELLMDKLIDIQKMQIQQAFRDISKRSIDAEIAIKRARGKMQYKLDDLEKRFNVLHQGFKDVFDKRNPEHAKLLNDYTLVHDFLFEGKSISETQVKQLKPHLKDIVRKYSKLSQQLRQIEKIEETVAQGQTIYQGLMEYVSDKQKVVTGVDTYNSLDVLLEQLNDYTYKVSLTNKVYDGFDNTKGDTIFFGKGSGNRYYAEKRLMNVLNLCVEQSPSVYRYFINEFQKYLDIYYKSGLSDKQRNEFLDLLSNLRKVTKQIKTLDKMQLIKPNTLIIENGKLVARKALPQSYKRLVKTVTNLTEKELYNLDMVKSKLHSELKLIMEDIEHLEDIGNISPAFFNKIADVLNQKTTSETLANEMAKQTMTSILNDNFIDGLFNYEKARSAFIRKSTTPFHHGQNIISKSFVVFDTETTGETSHGVYSIYATRWAYVDGKWTVVSRESFSLNPNFIEANWKIDPAVDSLNAYGSADYVGSTIRKAKELYERDIKDGRIVYNTDQEMAEAFRAYLQDGDILVAHNSAFDFGELMNAMSGGKFMIEGVIDEDAAEEFAKANFDFTVMDTALLQSSTGIFADTKQLTNSWLGRASGFVDVVEEFIDANKKKTIFFNGEEVKEIPFTKKKILKFEYDENQNITKGTYNGGALHEAMNDVELMNAWFEGGLNKLTELDTTFDDLDNPDMFFNNTMSHKMNQLYTDDLKEEINILLKQLPDDVLEDEPNFVRRIKDCLLTLQDLSNSHRDRYKAALELKDILSSQMYKDYLGTGRVRLDGELEKIVSTRKRNVRLHKRFQLFHNLEKARERGSVLRNKLVNNTNAVTIEEVTEFQKLMQEEESLTEEIAKLDALDPKDDIFEEIPSKSYTPFSLDDIATQFVDFEEQVTREINKVRSIHSKDLIGHLKTNRFYVNVAQAINFKYTDDIQNLIALFTGNANGTLTGNFAEMSKVLDMLYKDPKYHLAFASIRDIRDTLKAMDDSMTWYSELISETDPNMYDTLENVIDRIKESDYFHKPTDQAKKDIIDEVSERAKQNGFDSIRAIEMATKIMNNIDNLIIPDSARISELYNKCLDVFSALLKNIEEEGLQSQELVMSFNAKAMRDLINNAIDAMRVPLRGAKAENNILKQMPFTAKEFSEMSMVSEDTVNKIKASSGKHTFQYMGKGIEFDPTNHMHRVTPGEAIAWRSKYVPKFYEAHKNSIQVKSKINNMLSSLFKKTDEYKALPYIDASQSRLVQYFQSAATAFNMDLESMINNVYNNGAYKEFEQKIDDYVFLFEHLLKLPDEELAELGIDKLAFLRFTSDLSTINEFTFSYISDYHKLKDMIIATTMHNLLKGEYKLFSNLTRLVPSAVRETANKIMHDGFLESQMQDSIRLFSDIKSIYTNLDGSYDTQGFLNYLKTHPDYYLVYMDANGKFTRLENTPEIINEVLSSDDIFATVMSKNNYIQLTNYVQPIKLGPKARWFQQNILRPMKMLSLTNLNFVFQNVMSATFQNMISTSGKVDAPKAIGYMVRMARDYHRYTDIAIAMTSSYSARKYLTGSLYSMDKRWVELLDDDEFKALLKANNEDDVLEMIEKLTPEDIERLKFINEARNTSAARGEISSITLNNAREKALEKEAAEAEKTLSEKYGSTAAKDMLNNLDKYKNHQDYDTIATLVAQANYRKYQKLPVEELQKMLNELNEKDVLDYHEKKRKYVLENILRDKESNVWDAVFKNEVANHWYNFNENLETIFRLSAMDMYIKEGSTFDEATAEVIKRHFIYNNKSAAEQYAEFVIPFISYPLRMLSLVDDIASDSTVMDMMFWFDKYSWGEEEHEQSDYLTRRKARGDIPVGDKLFSLGSPFKEGVMNFQNPLYSLNNKINPLAKPFIDLATGSEYNRWNQLPGVSIVNGYANIIKERSLVANFTNDYYRYERFTNYYRPRVNNKIYGSLYNRMYTKSGHSRVLMNMQPLSSSNLKYRVNSIMKYSGPTNTRR